MDSDSNSSYFALNYLEKYSEGLSMQNNIENEDSIAPSAITLICNESFNASNEELIGGNSSKTKSYIEVISNSTQNHFYYVPSLST